MSQGAPIDENADLDLLTGDDRVVTEAKKRFRLAEVWESDFRKAFVSDIKFANADAENGWQWPNEIRRNRDIDQRPCLTVNKTHQHCLQIINDAKQHKPAVKIRPTGGGASYESSEVYENAIRRIEYQSNAQAAYDSATVFQVQGGMGYWRIVTDYASDDSFDQEIFIRRIKDPLNVYIDPNIVECDGSDARWGFVFDNMPREEFEEKYPDLKHISGRAALGNTDNWMSKEHVRVAEYYRVLETPGKLIAFTDPATQQLQVYNEKEIDKELLRIIKEDPTTRERKVTETKIEWYLIAGDEIIEREDWPGKYIPIVRLIGEELIVNGELDRKGHARALRDPQRIYNYWSSAAVEQVALQGKTPYIAPVKAIEGYETYWESANTVNHAILPYNHVDDAGAEIPMPNRQQPPTMASAYIQGLQISSNEMMMVSGQYQSMMGQQGNEVSGKAINERQRQGENSTYGYIDNLGIAIRHTGKILIDLIPKVYDTQRLIKVMDAGGEGTDIMVDPGAKAAYAKQAHKITGEVTHIFNPNVGKYEVEADIGPSYGTRRQEAFNAFSQIAAQNPQMMSIVGDLLFKSADFPGADEIAERLERLVPPAATGNGPSPQEQHMQLQVQNLQQALAKTLNDLTAAKLEAKNKSEQNTISEYDAVTSRLKTLLPTMINPKDIALAIADLMKAEQTSQLPQIASQEPVPATPQGVAAAMNPQVQQGLQTQHPLAPALQQSNTGAA